MSKVVACSSCKGSVDSHARVCPHCGKVSPAHLPVGVWVMFGLMLVAGIVFIVTQT